MLFFWVWMILDFLKNMKNMKWSAIIGLVIKGRRRLRRQNGDNQVIFRVLWATLLSYSDVLERFLILDLQETLLFTVFSSIIQILNFMCFPKT